MCEPRTRTKPEVKELAALAGEMQKIDREVSRLRKRRAAIVAKHRSLAKVAALAAIPALPDLVPPVRAHGRYGGRGKLNDFFRTVLRAAYPDALDSRTLGEMAVHHFAAAFETDEQRRYFRADSAMRALRLLVHKGEVERLHDLQTNAVGGWRWRVDAPTLGDLRAHAVSGAQSRRVVEG